MCCFCFRSGFWEEDRAVTQKFFNHTLGQHVTPCRTKSPQISKKRSLFLGRSSCVLWALGCGSHSASALWVAFDDRHCSYARSSCYSSKRIYTPSLPFSIRISNMRVFLLSLLKADTRLIENPTDERVNIPAVRHHLWKYRQEKHYMIFVFLCCYWYSLFVCLLQNANCCGGVDA